MNYICLDGKICFHCALEGHKLDAIRANGKVCFTVLSAPHRNEGEWWNCFTSVVVFGRIAEVTDPAKAERALRALGEKYFPEGYDIETDLRRNGPRALVLELTIDHVSGKHVREK
ncbi:MAG: pyridoxamine 5'-phosphate oxidase family protein [Bacteroidales bacterium]|nr:pyridoxamine 5'-phosphate oxidase family protein [Bacteroidales bacterium]